MGPPHSYTVHGLTLQGALAPFSSQALATAPGESLAGPAQIRPEPPYLFSLGLELRLAWPVQARKKARAKVGGAPLSPSSWGVGVLPPELGCSREGRG